MQKYLNPRNDYAFKRIFGTEKNKDILIALLNTVLKTQLQKPVIHVEFLSPIQDPEVLAKKQSIVDLLCKDQDGCRYIVEMQVANQKGFKERAQYYASKAFVSQIHKGGAYYDLKKIIFLAFTNFPIFPDKEDYKSEHETRDKKTNTNDLTKLRFTFVDLTKFEKKRAKSVKDLSLEEKFYYFLANAESVTPTEKDELRKEPIIKRALKELNIVNWTAKELDTYEQIEKIENDNKAVLDFALDRALEEGMAKGIQKGMAKGIQKGKQTLLKQLLAKGLLTPEQINDLE